MSFPAAASKALFGVRFCWPVPCAGSGFDGGPGWTGCAFLPSPSVPLAFRAPARADRNDEKQLVPASYKQKE
jgi:hypothetical protein